MTEKVLTASNQNSNKLLGLEVIRFISALSVLIWHYQHFAFIAQKSTIVLREQQPFYAVLRIFYEFGYWGVNVFWCISGFIFFWKYREKISQKITSGKEFFVLRFSRLYPLHLATLLLVVLMQPIYFRLNGSYFIYQNNDFLHFLLQLFMASNWVSRSGDSFNGPIWSISVEVLIYFIFFLQLRFVGKAALINIFVLAFCVALKYAQMAFPISECLTYFYLGGLSAIVSRNYTDSEFRPTLCKIAWCIVIVLPFIIWILRLYELKHFQFVFSILYTPTLMFCASQHVVVGKRIQKFIEAAGNMTYSSYLLHFPVQLLIAIFFSYSTSLIPLYNSTFFIAYMTFILMASYFTYRFFELPAQRSIRARFTSIRPAVIQVP